MKKYKVLKVDGDKLYSPHQNYYYGKINDVVGRQLICSDFDDSNEDCSRGFYATGIDGIIYSLNKNVKNKVFEVEAAGRSVLIDVYKQRFEKQTILRQVPDKELKHVIKDQSDKMEWDYYHACFPVNPLRVDVPINNDKASALLKEWSSIRDSIRDSVWDSVRDSVWASVWAYVSSLFPNVKEWKYVNHKKGTNPFQASIDLWHMGLVPSFDGEILRLHKGENAEVVIELRGGQKNEKSL